MEDARLRLTARPGSDADVLDLAQFGADSFDLLLAALPLLVGCFHRIDHAIQVPDDPLQVLLDLLHVFDQ